MKNKERYPAFIIIKNKFKKIMPNIFSVKLEKPYNYLTIFPDFRKFKNYLDLISENNKKLLKLRINL